MAFRETLLTQMPGTAPDVSIFFHGQLFLRSEDGEICQVGVNPLADNHILSVEVRIKQAGKPDLIKMRHFGPLNPRQPEGMTIEVSPAADQAHRAAWKCISADPINYESGEGDPNDCRWLLNLEGPHFHKPQELIPTVFGTKDVIKLQGGAYYFTTAFRSGTQLKFKRTGGGLADQDFRGIGGAARASVFLQPNQSVLVKWNDGTQEQVATLTKASGISYEIYVENTPLFVQVDPDNLESYEELVHYYKVIPTTQVPAAGRFKMTPEVDVPDRDFGSPDIPCQITLLDGPAG